MQAFNYDTRGKLFFHLLPRLLFIFSIGIVLLAIFLYASWIVLLPLFIFFLNALYQGNFILKYYNTYVLMKADHLIISLPYQQPQKVTYQAIEEIEVQPYSAWGGQKYFILHIQTLDERFSLLFYGNEALYCFPHLLNTIVDKQACDIVDKKQLLLLTPNRKGFYVRG